MAKTTHTHRGHCQLCDNLQAVDNTSGLLAKHGYTKRWGFFMGTCPGSDHQPYERSADLLPAVIRLEGDTIKALRNRIKSTEAMATTEPLRGEATCTIELPHVAGRWARRGEHRVSCERMGTFENQQGHYTNGTIRNVVVFTPDEPFTFEPKYEHLIDIPTTLRNDAANGAPGLHSYGAHTAGEYADSWRKGELHFLNTKLKQHEDYRKWLQERLRTWLLQPLTPVAIRNEAGPGVRFKYGASVWTIVREGKSWGRNTRWECSCEGLHGRIATFPKSHVTKIINAPGWVQP